MLTRAPLAVALVCAGSLLGLAQPANALTCDRYSTNCTTPPPAPSSLSPTTLESPNPTPPESELPFSGSEVALVSLLAAGALAGGASLVLAGRRRRVTS